MPNRDATDVAPFPVCDWVYFATPARGSWTITREFVTDAKIILAHVYNKLGIRMPLVQRVQPGDKMLLVYGEAGKYSPIFSCTVSSPVEPVRNRQHSFDAFSYVQESLLGRLEATGYDPDPVLKRFTGISISSFQDLRDIKRLIAKPKGNNTLRRWDEVFP